MLHVFFSYTGDFAGATARVVDVLKRNFAAQCANQGCPVEPVFYFDWRDNNVPAGSPLKPELKAKIERSNVFVAVVTEYYEEKIAGQEFDEFVKVSGPKRLVPILIGASSLDVWNRLKAKALIPHEEPVHLDLMKEGLSGNDLTTKGEDDLIKACKAAVEFVRDNAPPPPEAKPGKRPGVVVMGASHDSDPAEVSEARAALVGELSGKLPEDAVVDLGHGWDEDERVADTSERLESQTGATDLCLVSVQPIRRVEGLIASLGPDRARLRLKQSLEPVAGRFDDLSVARKLHSLVWIVGGENSGLGDLDGVDFVSSDAKTVGQQALYRVGAASECPFLLEDFGQDKLASWFQLDLPKLLSGQAEKPLERPFVMSKEEIRNALREASEDGRRILAISDQGAPLQARQTNGSSALLSHVLERIKDYEDLIAEAGPTRRDSTLRLLFQISGYKNSIGRLQAAPNSGKDWHILRIEPTKPEPVGELTEQKKRIRSFLAGEAA